MLDAASTVGVTHSGVAHFWIAALASATSVDAAPPLGLARYTVTAPVVGLPNARARLMLLEPVSVGDIATNEKASLGPLGDRAPSEARHCVTVVLGSWASVPTAASALPAPATVPLLQVTPRSVVTIVSMAYAAAELAEPGRSASTVTVSVVPGPLVSVPPVVLWYVIPVSEDLNVRSPGAMT